MYKRCAAVVAAIGLIALASCGSDDDNSSAASTPASSAPSSAAPSSDSPSSSAPDTSGSGASTPSTGSGEAGPAIPDGPIKIGVSLSLTGPLAGSGAFFKQVYESVTLASFNARYPDGIDGHQLQLLIEDDGSDPTTGAAVANKFVDEGVAAVMHLSDTPEVRDVQAAILSKAKIPVISYATSTDLEDTSKYPYNFGISLSPSLNKAAEVAWFEKHPEIKTIGILTDNSPSVQQDLDTMHELADAGKFEIAETAEVNTTTLNFGTAIAQLQQADPDLVVVLTTGAYGNIWQAMLGASYSPQILTGSNALFNGYAEMKTLAPNVKVLTSGCIPSEDTTFPKTVTDLMDQYATATGGASPSLLVYVQTNDVGLELLKTAVEKYGSTDPEFIKKAIEGYSGDIMWPGNTYTYSPTNHYGITGVYGANVCGASPLVQGQYQLPLISE